MNGRRAAALVLLALALAPLVWWGNPYPRSALMYWAAGGGLVLMMALLTAYVPALQRLAAPDGPIGRMFALPLASLSSTQFTWCVALLASAMATWCAWAVFHFGVSTTDEIAQLWHARILLTGRWALPVDPDRAFFALDTVLDGQAWYSQFPVGGPLLLAIGMLVGAPWLANVLITGASAAALYRFAHRIYGERDGRLIAIVFALAPSIVIMGGTMMNHVPTLGCWIIVLWQLSAWESAATPLARYGRAGVIGLALGAMATLRPLDAVVASVATGAFQLALFRASPRRSIEWLAQVIGGALGAAPVFIANLATTGHPLRFAYEVQWSAAHALGFHVDPYGRAFTPQIGLEQTLTYIGELSMFVTAWPIPSMVLVIASIWLVATSRSTPTPATPTSATPSIPRWDLLLLGHLLLQVAVYATYWGRGEFLGPRFLFTALPTLIVFIGRLPGALAAVAAPRWLGAIPVALATCLALAWGAPSSWLGMRGLMRIAANARQTLRIDVDRVVRTAGVDRALIFLREPFGARLSRRLWGVGLSRSDAAQLLATRDACDLYGAVSRLEDGPPVDAATTRRTLGAARPFAPSDTAMESADGALRLNGPTSLTAACKAEFDADTTGGFVAFGAGLPLEPIDANGRINGNIIYAADLGALNARLARRFGDRTWYRLRGKGGAQATLEPVRRD